MQKEDYLEKESEKVDKIISENKNQKPSTKSKNRKKNTVNDATKRIKDYFPIIPKSNAERQPDNGDGGKDESRVTQHTTPDKPKSQNDKSQNICPDSGKLVESFRPLLISQNILDICGVPHCCYCPIGAKP